ncbi:EF-hand domain-containing protein [Anatilimnocola floriformis]|uniref:EF-hand domain-containing protein n=1 Tax=Anatilimnocola floriformis TaxID=2948575 RepID=UPI0020C543B2|nr:EF-hand domain-containing protein [Anatilimnocola floriformis]
MIVGRLAVLCCVIGLATTALAGDCELQLTGLQGPVRARLEIQIGDRKFVDVWQESFAELTKFYDFDGDQKLNAAEAARLPSVAAFREVLAAGFTPSFGDVPEFAALDANSDKFVDASEVAAFYRAAGLGQPFVGAGKMTHTKSLNAALVKMLDADGNGQVSIDELKKAASAIAKFDRNDDEMIGAGELVAGLKYPGAAGSYLLKAAAKEAPSKPKFAAAVLPASKEETSAEFVVAIRIVAAEADKAKPPVLSAASPAEAKLSGGSLTLTKPGLQFVLRADPGRLQETSDGAYKRLERRFGDDDTNDDAQLDAAEIEKSQGTEWKNLLAIADRNADSQLAETELKAWLALQKQFAAGQVLLTLLDGGSGLFELLDGNRDGALSAAELRAAVERAEKAGAIQDGQLDLSKLPTTIVITASAGYPQSVLGVSHRSGPAWFLAMDRNLDGEVSRREFTGPAAAFTRLDTNGDDILSEAEATAK